MGCRACEKPNVKYKKGLWSPDEDERLRDYVLRHGLSCWSSVPAKAGLQRNGKSCRLRWINYLRPGLKRGNFSREEEEVVVRLQAKLGNKWSQIAMHLPGRTDNEVKNYWNSYLKKKVIKPQKQGQISTSSSSLQTQQHKSEEPPKKRGDDQTSAVNYCNLPRVLFGDWLDNFDSSGSGGGGGEGLFNNLDEAMSCAKNTLHGSSLGSSKLELEDGDNCGGFVDGFDEMYEGIINQAQQESTEQVPESSALFDMFPWCDDF